VSKIKIRIKKRSTADVSKVSTHITFTHNSSWTVQSYKHCNNVMPQPTRGLEVVIMAWCSKSRCTKFLWEKQGYRNAATYGNSPRPNRLKYTTFDTKHLDTAWVADAASFRGAWVRNRQRSSECIHIFQHSANYFPDILNYFQPRCAKPLWARDYYGYY
jgi:hypothetical protein